MKTKRLVAALTLMAAVCTPAFCSSPVKVKPAPAQQKTTTTVYVTKKGKKFHKSNCSKLTFFRPIALKRYEAEGMGYQPCKRCHPQNTLKQR